MNIHARISRVLRLLNTLRVGSPKSVLTLCRLLNVSERSVYRYLQTLRDLGYPLESDAHGRVFLSDRVDSVHNTDSPHAELVRLLDEAIAANEQIRLKHYASISSGTVSDRLVEPIGFTLRNLCLVAWEPATQRNNYFRLDRISGAEPTGAYFERSHQHRIHPPDLFGFNFNGQLIDVSVRLTLKGKLLLEEQYPSVVGLVKGPDSDRWHTLETIVHDESPLMRFANGLPGDVVIRM